MSDLTYEQQRVLRESIERACKMAVTYLRKSRDSLWWYKTTPRMPAYWDVLDAALDTATHIVEELDDGFFEDEPTDDGGLLSGLLRATYPEGMEPSRLYNSSDQRLEVAKNLVALIEKRRSRTVTLRKVRALENTTGRSPEEAESYKAKAAELRSKLD